MVLVFTLYAIDLPNSICFVHYVVNSDTHCLLVLLVFQVDTKGTGVISALDAATFLKKSGLSVGVLSQVSDV